MASQTPTTTTPARGPEIVISAEADRALLKVTTRYLIIFFLTFFAVMIVMTLLNARVNPHSWFLRPLNLFSSIFLLIPIYMCANKVFGLRLKYGREFVQNKEWKPAVASLEAFSHFGQRILDPTGEAHYLLSVALSHVGKQDEAERARKFVLKARPSSQWAALISGRQGAKPSAGKIAAKRTLPGAPAAQENTPRPPKGKRRRF